MAERQQQQHEPPTPPELRWLDGLANVLDNQFRIPGTNIRFGLDAIMGLVPGVGDIAGLGVATALFWIMLRNGAGPILMLRMAWNVALDAVVGIVPIVGDLFDVGYKANRRNVDLLKAYYAEGKPRPNTIGSALLLFVLALVIMVVLAYGVVRLVAASWGWFWLQF